MRPLRLWSLAVLGCALSALAVGCGLGGKPQRSATAQFEELVSQGKLAEAESLCRKTVQSNPNDWEARGKLVRVLCLQGEASLQEAGFFDKPAGEAAEAQKYSKARTLFGSAIAEAQTVLKDHPNLASVRATLGLALYRLGQTKQAVEELKRAISDNGELPEAYNTLGLIHYEAGRTDEALACYQSALALQSDLPDTSYNVAVLYRGKSKQPGGTVADRDAAIRYYQLYLRSGRKEYSAQAKAALAELEAPSDRGGKEAAGGRKG